MVNTIKDVKTVIVIFGDSNSWKSFNLGGEHGDAYPEFLRSDEVEVIVDAVPGRSTIFDVETGTRGQVLPGEKESRNGFESLKKFVAELGVNGKKIDKFVLSLGTNDLMNPSLNQSVIDVKNNLKLLVAYLNLQRDIFNNQPEIFVLTPFSVSKELHPEISHKITYLEIALKDLRNVKIVTVGGLKPGSDGVHFSETEHRKIAEELKLNLY